MIAFHLPGNLPVYTFSLLLGLGAAAGLAWALWQAHPRNVSRLISASLWTLIGALAGSRAAYLLVNWPYYRAHLAETFQFQLGGLAWPGALAGALLALALYAWLNRQPFAELAGSLMPQLMLLSLAAWIGCWLDGCAYGPASFAWWSLPARDEFGLTAWRFPTQLLGALLTLALFWLVDSLRPRWKTPITAVGRDTGKAVGRDTGLAAGLALLGLMAVIFASSFLRADPGLYWHGLRLDAWAALAFGLLAGLYTGLTSLR